MAAIIALKLSSSACKNRMQNSIINDIRAQVKTYIIYALRRHALEPTHGYIRDVLARDEPTRTRGGPLPSWTPKIKTLKFFQTLRF